MEVMKVCGMVLAMIMVLLLQGIWCSDNCWETERTALLQLQSHFNYSLQHDFYYDRYLYVYDYSTSSPEIDVIKCCNWGRVRCSATTGRITQLNLDGIRDFSAGMMYLNTSLFLPFQHLNHLDLSFNDIAGCLKNEGFQRLSSLENLEFLNLGYNNFNNDILSSLTHLSSLKYLYLDGNLMKGRINIEDLNSFTNLKNLSIRDNEIEGFKSFNGGEEILNMSNLQLLDIGYNHIENDVLSTLRGLSSLKTLWMYHNQLNGSFDLKELDTMSNLEELNLGGNNITKFIGSKGMRSLRILKALYLPDIITIKGSSTLLESLGALAHLEILDLSWSNFEGATLSLGAFTNLKILRISGSDLKGTRFAQDSSLTNLKELYLDDSYVDGNFLQSLEALSFLETLSMQRCGLSGIPVNLGICKLKHLQMLDISANDLSGNLPLCLANLTSLRQLHLSVNHFIGNISSSPLGGLTNLEHLSLSNNLFQIPISLSPFFNHSKLKYMESRGNKIFAETDDQYLNPRFQLERLVLSSGGYYGAFPKFLYHQHNLQFVDLSHNQMREGFPSWLLQNNTKLKKLYLINNSLSGPLKLPIHSHMNLSLLDISDNFFQGFITPEIGTCLPRLTYLSMSGNGFSGSIPSSFGNMSLLENLDLSNNRLLGTIPEDLTIGCVSLQELILSNNSLQGQIFSETSNLRFLYELQLDGNQFTGNIPRSLSNNSFIEVLDLRHNNLYGRIPRWLGNMHFLRVLDLSMNNISGSLPSNLFSSNIQEIYLSRNGLQGSLEDAFYACYELNVLDSDHNHMTGSISSCQNLRILDISYNHLSGKVPNWIRNMSSLQILDLSQNNISGSLPSNFCPRDLTEVHLSKNKLQGLLMDSFSNCYSLVVLDLSHNNLIGRIPKWIGEIPLGYILLSHNLFEGEIPIQLCKLDKLSLIDLSYNNLSGHIPHCLRCSSNWYRQQEALLDPPTTALAPSVAYSPDIQPEQPVEFTTKNSSYFYQPSILHYFSGIDLSCNNLAGEVPPELGNLDMIKVLNLSHNKLIGAIPPTFSNLRQIESLDLSYNNLQGKIPSQLTQLNFLAVFSVAHNNLSGKTPEMVSQFATFEQSSYEGNPLLCGLPLPTSCNNTPPLPPATPTEEKEDNGFMDMGVFYISFVVSYIMVLVAIAAVLCINPYWRRRWFYFIETSLTNCYYFLVDNIPLLSKLGVS